jgi:hypothetical protein
VPGDIAKSGRVRSGFGLDIPLVHADVQRVDNWPEAEEEDDDDVDENSRER